MLHTAYGAVPTKKYHIRRELLHVSLQNYIAWTIHQVHRKAQKTALQPLQHGYYIVYFEGEVAKNILFL